jgi:Arc/MetJ-type ribon-helix-helix transcriptional regulator
MTKHETIQLDAPEELVAALREAVANGEHASLNDLVRDALDEWNTRRTLANMPVAELQRLWREGAESGASQPLDMAEIKRKARARFDGA